MTDPRAVARAIDALRRGWPVAILGAEAAITVLAVETADPLRLAAFDPEEKASVLLSAGRAATLKLANQRDAAVPDSPVLVERAPWLDFAAATALADPQLDLATPLKGPFRATPLPSPDAAQTALQLARLAGVLPAFFLRLGQETGAEAVTLADVAAHEDPARLTIATRARLPVAGAEMAEIVAFRTPESPASISRC